MNAAIEIEKLTSLGEQAGLAGTALLEFVKAERAELKQQRDEDREMRAAERTAEREKRELEKEKLQLERDKIGAQERLCQQQYEFDRKKAADERDFIREQAEEEEKRVQGTYDNLVKNPGKVHMKGIEKMVKLTGPDPIVSHHKVDIIIQSKVGYQNYRPLMNVKTILMHT